MKKFTILIITVLILALGGIWAVDSVGCPGGEPVGTAEFGHELDSFQ